MISDFTAQLFGGNKNCVNAKFKLLLNHSNLIIMIWTVQPWPQALAGLDSPDLGK